MVLADTDPKAMEVWLDLLRKKTPGEKLEMTFGLTEMIFGLQESAIRSKYPHATEREVFLRCAARRLDRDTMIKVYGWDPNLHAPIG